MAYFKGGKFQLSHNVYSAKTAPFPKISSEFLETLGGVAVIIGGLAVIYCILLLACAVDNSCASIFMEPVR